MNFPSFYKLDFQFQPKEKTKLKKFFKWTGTVILLILIGLITAVFLRQNMTYDAPYPEIKASKDSSVIARGRYLVHGPAHCLDCHAPAAFADKVAKGEDAPLSGGNKFELPVGDVYSRNITPDTETGIGEFKDNEIARLLRYGVGRDGRAILDFMPFHNMTDEDLTAVISYIRTVPPVKNKVPPNDYNFLGKFVKAFLLKPVGPDGEVKKHIDQGATAEYGKYLARYVSNCVGCHTERDLKTGKFIGQEFAGGLKLETNTPGVSIVTPNITTDPKTGKLATWSEDDFIKRFRQGKVIAESIMPWGPFSRMTDDELKAIYRYLKTVAPVERDNGPVLVRN